MSAVKLTVQYEPQRLSINASPESFNYGFGNPIARETIERDPYEGDYEITPDETGTLLATNNKRMTDDVTVNAIPSDYVGSAIDRRDETDLTVSGPTVTVPEGYYEDTETATVQSGSAATPATAITANPTITFASGTGYIEANVTASQSVTPSVSEGYVESGTAGNSAVSLSATDANYLASNIKSGVSLFGLTGTYTGGGGSSDFKSGTLTVSTAVNTSTNTKITDTTTIGFTPSVFVFARSDRSATSNHINAATFVRLGTSSYYIRTRTRYSSNALSTSGDTNNWTTQSSGYLYFNSNTVYFRSSSSYILASGTWNWYAIK